MDGIGRTNQAVMRLWQHTFSDDADVYMPLIYPPIKKDVVLFVSLNPSFSQEGFRAILRDTQYSQISPVDFFHWRNRARFDLGTAQAIEVLAKNKYAFFGKFKDIARYVAVDWEHIDLFFNRQTNQDAFKQAVYDDDILSEFGRRQLELSKGLVVEACPRVIVVANAFASRVFAEEFNAEFDEEHGYHTIQLHGQVVPVFLASMLTGQRAMDVNSYQRLRWHIKKTLDQIQ
jgi:hypothetical protein